jgi:exopolyphosphatase/pppGpp-phosphohydrolase
LLHDIGRKDGPTRHHVRGAKIIMRDSTLELSPEARQFAAYAARHHRGPIPDYADDRRYLSRRQQKEMRILLAIIRAADALDKRGRQRPRVTLRRSGRDVVVELRAADGSSLKGLGKRRKFRMLRQELDARIRIVLH